MASQFCRVPCPAKIDECNGVCRVMKSQHANQSHECSGGHRWQHGVCNVCKGTGKAQGSLICGTCSGKGYY